jgi:hypothetical protein
MTSRARDYGVSFVVAAMGIVQSAFEKLTKLRAKLFRDELNCGVLEMRSAIDSSSGVF